MLVFVTPMGLERRLVSTERTSGSLVQRQGDEMRRGRERTAIDRGYYRSPPGFGHSKFDNLSLGAFLKSDECAAAELCLRPCSRPARTAQVHLASGHAATLGPSAQHREGRLGEFLPVLLHVAEGGGDENADFSPVGSRLNCLESLRHKPLLGVARPALVTAPQSN